jgi:hypothetical protein
MLIYNYQANANIILATATTTGTPVNRLTITGDGNVGIGITNPAYRLDTNGILRCTEFTVRNAAAWDHGRFWHDGRVFYMDAGGAETGIIFRTEATSVGYPAASYTERMRITNSGRVGIATDPAVALHVIGDVAATGNITAYYSDERLKTITSNITNPLQIVGKLKGFYYHANELGKQNGVNTNRQEIGLSAQDVQKVLPELVSIAPFDLDRGKDGNLISKSGENYLTISYERLAPVFIEAIKELHNEIKLLKEENNNLRKNYESLLQEIQCMKHNLNLV